MFPGLVLNDDDIQNFVLADIEKLLLNIGKICVITMVCLIQKLSILNHVIID